MYTRLLPTPTRSIFLFGPRGTGKSTWIRDRFPGAVTYDLLDTGEALRLNKEPQALYRELPALPAGDRAVVDEVQKAPALLDEVHRLIESRRLRFVLSGSSARKLRRGGDPRGYLRTYAETYLMQEVQAEALTRNLGAFPGSSKSPRARTGN